MCLLLFIHYPYTLSHYIVINVFFKWTGGAYFYQDFREEISFTGVALNQIHGISSFFVCKNEISDCNERGVLMTQCLTHGECFVFFFSVFTVGRNDPTLMT